MDAFLIFMVIAVGAMFLLTSRTRKQQQRRATEFRESLSVGDEVMTHGGLFGTIVDKDGDVVTLESASGAQTEWIIGAISKLATPPYAEPLDSSDEDVEDEYEDDEYQDAEYEEYDEDAYSDDVEDEDDSEDLPADEDAATGEPQDTPVAGTPEDPRHS